VKSRAFQPQDLDELLAWIEAAEESHPEATIWHVEWVCFG